MGVVSEIVDFFSVTSPYGKDSAISRDLPATVAAREGRDVDLFPATVVSTVGKPLAVGRNSRESNFAGRRFGLHDHLGLTAAGGRHHPNGSAGGSGLLDVEEVAAVRGPFRPGQRNRQPSIILGREQQLVLPAAARQARMQRRTPEHRGAKLNHVSNALPVGATTTASGECHRRR